MQQSFMGYPVDGCGCEGRLLDPCPFHMAGAAGGFFCGRRHTDHAEIGCCAAVQSVDRGSGDFPEAAAVATFSYELRQGGAIARAEPAGTVVVNGSQVAAGKAAIHFRYGAATASSMLERTGVFLNEHAAVVVMVWMACLLVQPLRMTGGLYRIHRLRRQRDLFCRPGF